MACGSRDPEKRDGIMVQAPPKIETEALFSDRARFQRWLDVEASLARAQAALGVIPGDAARSISSNARVDLLDLHNCR